MRTTQALAADLGAKLILGINLAAGRPAIAAAEGASAARRYRPPVHRRLRDRQRARPVRVFPPVQGPSGAPCSGRGAAGTTSSDYTKQFTQWGQGPADVPLAGPVASGPALDGQARRLIIARRAQASKLVTYHRYPLRACVHQPQPNRASRRSRPAGRQLVGGLPTGVAPYVRSPAPHKLPFRLGEINSASCKGAPGVSDTFASALWALDTLFNMASVGVDGVNFHMLPGSALRAVHRLADAPGNWQAFVHPEYYALLMFAQAFPPGAHLLPRHRAQRARSKVWATDATEARAAWS